MTVFLRTQHSVDLVGANYLLGSLYYTLVRLMTNGVAELIMTITRLPVVYKQKAFYLYPAWAYCLPSSIIKIPFSVLDSLVWTSITYYVIGYSPEITRQVACVNSQLFFYLASFPNILFLCNQVLPPVSFAYRSAYVINLHVSFPCLSFQD